MSDMGSQDSASWGMVSGFLSGTLGSAFGPFKDFAHLLETRRGRIRFGPPLACKEGDGVTMRGLVS